MNSLAKVKNNILCENFLEHATRKLSFQHHWEGQIKAERSIDRRGDKKTAAEGKRKFKKERRERLPVEKKILRKEVIKERMS
jgi:hypothetical protein